ncbi:MAG: type II toxin-antitoxin system VapC family toxin [Bacteroidales bacterium]|nr:type II toxin-antitoxin system VapC family toxin [Bacteroidales bacterium]
MKITVSDANILIDLADLDLINEFVRLDFEFHTNDFVIDEIKNPEQKEKIEELIKTDKLFVAQTKSEEYQEILELQTKNLSFADCSIWHYAIKTGGILLSGDGILRKTASKQGITVKGIFFIFDKLIETQIIDNKTALEKIKLLNKINNRLPYDEIEKRISLWKDNIE